MCRLRFRLVIRHCEVILAVCFFTAFCGCRPTTRRPTAKVSEELNLKLPARNTTVQLLPIYTDPVRHNAQRYRRTDRHYDVNSRVDYTACSTYYVGCTMTKN